MVSTLTQASLHSFGGVVDEVGKGALHGFRIDHDERQPGFHLSPDFDSLEPSGEEHERVFDGLVEVRGPWLRGRELRECSELVDQCAHGFNASRV